MIEHITGTQTSATLNWTGKTTRTKLYDDMIISFKLPYNSGANPNLELSLYDGTSTGQISIYSDTTYFAANDEVQLTYSSKKDGRVGWYTKEVYDGQYKMPIFECYSSIYNSEKYIANDNITVTTGKQYIVRFAYGNTYEGSLTIRVNYAMAAPLYINDKPTSATNYRIDPGYYSISYDGTNWYLRTDGKLNADILGTANKAVGDENGDRISTTYAKTGEFAVVTGTTNSATGWSSYIDYPTGFDYTNSQVISFEVNVTNSWRTGVGVNNSSFTRTFVAIDSTGIRLYNADSGLYSVPFRVTLRKLS